MKFAYADPPYFGCGQSHYGEHHDEAAVWDDKATHLALIERLVDDYPDGWALSCNPRDLAWLLPACPDDTRVAAWCKTWHQIRPTTVQYAWEPVIWRGGRKDPKRSPMIRDWMSCAVTRQRGLKGAKPDTFNQWVLDLLAYRSDEDTLDDIFPGTGGMAATLAAAPLTFRSDLDDGLDEEDLAILPGLVVPLNDGPPLRIEQQRDSDVRHVGTVLDASDGAA